MNNRVRLLLAFSGMIFSWNTLISCGPTRSSRAEPEYRKRARQEALSRQMNSSKFQKQERQDSKILKARRLLQEANNLLGEGYHREAFSKFRAATVNDPSIKEAWLGMAKAKMVDNKNPTTNSLHEVVGYLKSEIKINPKNKEASEMLSKLEEQVTAQEKAEEDAKKRLQEDKAQAYKDHYELEATLRSQSKKVGKLKCAIQLFRVYINTRGTSAVRTLLKCENRTSKPQRLAASDMILVDESGNQYNAFRGDRYPYADMRKKSPWESQLENIDVTMIRNFVDIPAKQFKYIRIFFLANRILSTDSGLVLDVRGTKFNLSK
jgi:hypothetical protein